MIPDPAASAPSISAAPPRNVLIAAVSGAISAVIVALAKRYLGDFIPPELVAAVPVLVAALVAYLVPMTTQDVADRTSNHTVVLANLDPANPTTAKVVPEVESDAITQAALRAGVVPEPLAKKIV